MPTEKPRFTITMDDDLYKQISEYRFANRMKSQTQAVLDLIDKGLCVLLDDHPVSKEDIQIKKYRTLDEYGKKAVDAVLDIEYERCQQNNGNLLAAARHGQRVKANQVDNLDELIPSEDANNI